MARPPRIDFPNALYHVTSRGNGRQRIFWTDQDRQRFLAQLGDAVHTAGVVLYGFVLMDNHFHLLARTPRANLSRFTQRLNTSYALYARYKHRRPGHQLDGRQSLRDRKFPLYRGDGAAAGRSAQRAAPGPGRGAAADDTGHRAG